MCHSIKIPEKMERESLDNLNWNLYFLVLPGLVRDETVRRVDMVAYEKQTALSVVGL